MANNILKNNDIEEERLTQASLAAPDISGMTLSDNDPANFAGQVIYLDFKGATNVAYNNEALNIHVNGIDVADSGLDQTRINQVIAELNTTYAGSGVFFTVTAPTARLYSTVYVGSAGSAFAQYGNFLGLSETIDTGDKIKNDNAFVFSDKIASADQLAATIAHEAGHLLGYQHIIAADTTQLSAYSFTDSVPLLNFKTWDQGGTYNKYCPIDPYDGKRSLVGCGAVALAQLMYYWHYPTGFSFTADEQYVNDYGAAYPPCIIGDSTSAQQYKFLSFSELNNKLNNLKFNFSDDEKAAMSFAAGIILQMQYSSIGSGSLICADELTDYLTWNFNARQSNFDVTVIVDNLEKGQPVIASLWGGPAGHYALVDGYRKTDGKFHVNMGWAGSSDGWYSLPTIGIWNVDYLIVDIFPSSETVATNINQNIDFSLIGMELASSTFTAGDKLESIYVDNHNGSSTNTAVKKFCKVEVFLSTDSAINTSDLKLGYFTATDGLAPGETGTLCISDLLGVNTVTIPAGLTAGTYYIGSHLVTANDPDDSNNWISGGQITVKGIPDSIAPTVPARLFAATSGNNISFSWTASTDSISGIKQYEFRVDNNSDFSSPEYTNTVTASQGAVTDIPVGTYFWEVRAQDNAGNYSAWSKSSSFIVTPSDTAANDYKTAKNISDGVDNWVGYGDAADCYELTLTDAGLLTLSLTGLSGNADLSLLSSSGKVLKTSANKDNAGEAINDFALLAGDYYIKVASAKGVNSAGYTLNKSFNPFPADNAGSTPGDANVIGELEDGVAAECSDWTGFGDPADCYQLTLTNAGTLSLNLDLTGLSGDANLTLLDSKGKVLKTSSTKGHIDEAIATPLLAGDYFVKIAPADGGKGIVNNTTYTLSNVVDYFPTETAGNIPSQAGSLDIDSSVDEWVGFGDPADYYQLTLTNAGALNLNLTGLSSDANLTLLNSAGKVLKTSANKKSADEAIATALAAGDYLVKVAPADGGKGIANNTY